MHRTTDLLNGPYGTYVRTLIAARFDRLRQSLSHGDAGASAIELAIITAIIGAVALALAIIIQQVVTNNGNTIKGL